MKEVIFEPSLFYEQNSQKNTHFHYETICDWIVALCNEDLQNVKPIINISKIYNYEFSRNKCVMQRLGRYLATILKYYGSGDGLKDENVKIEDLRCYKNDTDVEYIRDVANLYVGKYSTHSEDVQLFILTASDLDKERKFLCEDCQVVPNVIDNIKEATKVTEEEFNERLENDWPCNDNGEGANKFYKLIDDRISLEGKESKETILLTSRFLNSILDIPISSGHTQISRRVLVQAIAKRMIDGIEKNRIAGEKIPNSKIHSYGKNPPKDLYHFKIAGAERIYFYRNDAKNMVLLEFFNDHLKEKNLPGSTHCPIREDELTFLQRLTKR